MAEHDSFDAHTVAFQWCAEVERGRTWQFVRERIIAKYDSLSEYILRMVELYESLCFKLYVFYLSLIVTNRGS